ncbi:hypothetical protein [Synechococcus sp. CBW1107]|uniref:hypothetical protein n=1 Tax=Synechococcus sp. CBW1107 TaxID=2789857 RepID=UPI002AD37B71|nr:hypothetical protein [Synechococcus sp. CBW1107]
MPSLSDPASDFQSSAASSQDSITPFALGYGASQLLWGPLAMPMQAFPAQAGQASAFTGFLQQEGSGLLVVLALLLLAYGRLAPCR